jgi:hypothetical protein
MQKIIILNFRLQKRHFVFVLVLFFLDDQHRIEITKIIKFIMKIQPSTWKKKSANNLLTKHNCFFVFKNKKYDVPIL